MHVAVCSEACCEAEPLTAIAKDFPAVTIGSYPSTDESQDYGVKLSLQSRDKEALEAAAAAIRKNILK